MVISIILERQEVACLGYNVASDIADKWKDASLITIVYIQNYK